MKYLDVPLGAAKAIEAQIQELKKKDAGTNNGNDALAVSIIPTVFSFGASGITKTQDGSHNK